MKVVRTLGPFKPSLLNLIAWLPQVRGARKNCAKVLPCYLKASSSASYDTLEIATTKDWVKLLDALAKVFMSPGAVPAARHQLHTRKQRPDQSVAQYGQLVEQLISKAYPEAMGFTKEMQQQLAVDIFRTNLKSNLRAHILRKPPAATLRDAIAEAMIEEDLQAELEKDEAAEDEFVR